MSSATEISPPSGAEGGPSYGDGAKFPAGKLSFILFWVPIETMFVARPSGRDANVMMSSKRLGTFLLPVCLVILMIGKACSQESYGPYNLIGYNYTDRNIASFWVNGTWGGNSNAHRAGGGGGITCCLEISKSEKTLHIKVMLGLTQLQFDKNFPNDTFETDLPMPNLPNKHDGYVEVHFLSHRKIQAKWVELPTKPHVPNTTE